MVAGVWILRKRRAEQGIPPSRLQARNTLIIAYLASSILLLVLPWYVEQSGISRLLAEVIVTGSLQNRVMQMFLFGMRRMWTFGIGYASWF
jgi:hypothetical protein